MHNSIDLPLEQKVAAVLDWWRLAGVDLTFEDEPRSWLRANQAELPPPNGSNKTKDSLKPKRQAPPQKPRIGGDPEGWPQDFTRFSEWWLAELSLLAGNTNPRVAPRGQAGAELMVLVPMPETGDRDLLLSGHQGRLVDNMLAAMGLGQDTTYLAAALPCHLPEPAWPGLLRDGLGDVLLHLVSLARPKRLLVLGHGILPLLGHASAQAPATVRQTSIQSGDTRKSVPTMVGVAPGLLLENARQRAVLWRRWLDWTDADR